jgi:hypothetical protein
MRQLREVADFIWGIRRRLRLGKLPHAPLHLLRVELRHNVVEPDSMARPLDVWHDTLPPPARDHNEPLQALADAISMRSLFFNALPNVKCAALRIFRQPAREPPERIVFGTFSREPPAFTW